ncbi:TlpA family protein disulfide reductase [Luteibaculum oceani]|uniref:Redoxin domain-containing protein n=1 Tax=Luteibaculum oceani TaxID=1294296 RepID=A0A5C6UWH6_9FLAO|nr:TlpA disulfide reductase family protein [Luteibaculum oceani]TXC76930.1 redoxin domain-containing protein [Luteibaculum oceani]
MNKLKFIPQIIAAFTLFSCAETDPKEILQNSFQKCQSIQAGTYEMVEYVKFMSQSDTNKFEYDCVFKKLKDDSLYSSAFHYTKSFENGNTWDVMYTGNEFVSYFGDKDTGIIMNKQQWAEDIIKFRHNHTFYEPFTERNSYPIPHDSILKNPRKTFQLVGETVINGRECYQIRVTTKPENDTTDSFQFLRIEQDFWISKKDFIPLAYADAIDGEMDGDTMYQYNRKELLNYSINDSSKIKAISPAALPSHVYLKDYQPYKSPPLLANNTPAPNFTLISIDGDSISLDDYKGKVVLLDFFYKSCHPCMKALPLLNDLHHKYAEKGLVILGINPFDDIKNDDMRNFLTKREVKHLSLFGANKVAAQYNVSAYPTFYLIDKTGKITYQQSGYGQVIDQELEDTIKERL